MAVDPMMMGAGPMIPPPPGQMMGAPMPTAPTGDVPPAVGALPGIAQLAQEQTMQMIAHQRQMEEMKERMEKEVMLLIASMPTKNPAGEAAISAPLPPMMSSPDANNSSAVY